MTDAPRYTVSSGNIFADLGLPDAEELLPKADLPGRIAAVIQQRGLTQVQAADLLGIDQPRVSDLLRGRLRRFSFERLMALANAAGLNVDVVISSTADPGITGRTIVREESSSATAI